MTEKQKELRIVRMANRLKINPAKFVAMTPVERGQVLRERKSKAGSK